MSASGKVNPFFTPTQISGCGLWLDGADPNANQNIPNNNAAIATWIDKSGAAANGIVVGSAAIYKSGGGLFFAQSGAYNTSYSASLSNESLFVVHRYTVAPNSLISLVGQSGDGGRLLDLEPPNRRINSSSYNIAYSAQSPDNTITSNVIALGEMVTVNGAMGIFYNGTNYGNGIVVSLTAGRTSVVGGAYYLGSPVANQYFGGTLFEIVGYTVALNRSQRQQVEGYLAWKWGIQASLPSNHPYKSSPIPPLLSPPTTLPVGLAGIWQPTRFSNCQLWLDASKETRTGNITSIQDLTSNAYTGSTGLAIVQQRYLNKLNVWYFPSYVLSFNSFPWRTRFTLIFLLNTAGWAMTSQRVGGTGGYTNYYLSNNCYLFTVNGYGTLIGNDGSAAGSCGPDITPKNQWVIYVFAYNGGTLPSFYRFNGVDRTNVNTSGAGSVDTTIIDSMAINGSPSGPTNNSTNTYYAEHIHYNAGLSLQQIQTVEGYLAWKWGLQANLPDSHPFKRWPPAP